MTHIEAKKLRRERANAMAEKYLSGVSQIAIAKESGISRQRVHQLLKEIGVFGGRNG